MIQIWLESRQVADKNVASAQSSQSCQRGENLNYPLQLCRVFLNIIFIFIRFVTFWKSYTIDVLSRTTYNCFLIFFFLLLSLRLTGVETLESVSQNFKRRFHFLFLVSIAVGKLTARWNWVDEAWNLVSLIANNFSLGTIIFNFKIILKRKHFS